MSPKKRPRSGPTAKAPAAQESDAGHVATATTGSSYGRGSASSRPAASAGTTRGEKNVKARGTAELRQKLPSDLEGLVLRSTVIAPDVVGVRCMAVRPGEKELIVVRENGSIVLYGIDSFQNVPHFERIRHTGGRANRTITRVRYLPCGRALFLASYLSGQLVVYCGETLSPLHVHQRTGGAIWDFCLVGAHIYAAMADGSWQQLRVEEAGRAAPALTLRRIIPKVPGADRALSVCGSEQWSIAAGTDDAGNVVAWRLPREEAQEERGTTATAAGPRAGKEGAASNSSGARPMSLSDHEALWTGRLPKGMGLCCAVGSGAGGGAAPVVAVGTSMGDIVLFDAQHGHVLKTFTHHKGPVSTLVSSGAVLYASGWHESLRSYRAGADGEWFPAEVKRRTHYHEASELLVLQQQQLILSAARDGTVMYAPVDSVFTSPAMYLPVTTQQFAFAKAKNVLLQTRHGRIEAFRTDAGLRHWTPLFAYKVHGKFHIQGLWCDEQLRYMLFATDERAALLRVRWRDGAEDALSLRRIEEVVALPVGRGVLDCCFVQHGAGDGDGGAAATAASCYMLLDDTLVHITLAEGYPVVATAMQTSDAEPVCGIRPTRLLVGAAQERSSLIVCGRRGRLTCGTAPDGTPDPSSFVWSRESTRMAASVPALQHHASPTCVALTDNARYVAGIETAAPSLLPPTLPHDVRFIARLPPLAGGLAGATRGAVRFLACFSRGLLYVTESSWHMQQRCTVEAAFVLKGDARVLVLVRNLEGTLEALPMCWKVRRFGN
ncbi:putative aminopeptidase, putative,metallo-peptidase, Clan MG, Family M24 [Trypanosoma conorhini]|uniref:Putative aminopeptidase, putative,metallo-peptidase, Clan MG, Family M24 n=1 Tax=Trypanosoma conorhini TaxID=83891 RepID=A0A3S5IRX6_9TRYP|nr:putative aminopeptidase, putative,metallo-peptidase, Clan MG, Family M24 [Trypanosoma conorhini]RNF09222.1 putative aminopeptidase, putative,metallo-peptidase, Clan MG, Family M24 [Trypanosoma conorhini]